MRVRLYNNLMVCAKTMSYPSSERPLKWCRNDIYTMTFYCFDVTTTYILHRFNVMCRLESHYWGSDYFFPNDSSIRVNFSI